MNLGLEDAVRRLSDRAAIHDVLMRYLRGIDRLDFDLVRSCYHADATDTHGSFSGGIDEFLEWVAPLLASYDSTFHFAGNELIEIESDSRARSELYGIAHHRTAGGAPNQNLITGFRYIDDFERRGGGEWLIARRVATTEWVRVDEESGWFEFSEHLLRGRRDGSDPVFNPPGA